MMIPIHKEPEIAWISFLKEIEFVATRGEEMFEEEIKEGKIANFFLPCYEEYFTPEKIANIMTSNSLSTIQKKELLRQINDYRKKQDLLLVLAKKHLRLLEEQRSKEDKEYRENQKEMLDMINTISDI